MIYKSIPNGVLYENFVTFAVEKQVKLCELCEKLSFLCGRKNKTNFVIFAVKQNYSVRNKS